MADPDRKTLEKPWEAELELGAARATALIEAQFPELAPARLEPLGAGWDNSAFLVGGRWVFRFPRRQLAARLLAAEARVLPGLAGRLPLAVPRPIFFGEPAGDYLWPFAGYALVPGRTACRARLGEAARLRSAEPLAAFLSALHAIGPRLARELGAPPDELRRLDMPYRIPMVEERLERAMALGLVEDPGPFRELIAETPTAWRPTASALVHGDLYARHLLVNDEDTLAGVIDWGDVHLGDPTLDLAIAFTFLPAAGRRAFFATYGEVDRDRRRAARLRALFSALTILVYGRDIGDPDLLWEGACALQHLADRAG